MFQLFNSLSRKKETFKPQQEGKVGIYVCGITVYDFCHMGHARTYVSFDVIVRFLRYLGYDVNYVRNITDIDDKIIKRATESSQTIDSLTNTFIEAMHDDFDRLNILPATIEPRATDSMNEIIAMIQTIIANGHAYEGGNGDVYYAVDRFDGYGQLSATNLEQLQAGERVEIDQAKHNHFDFVLWKSAKPGEPSWDSPWGKGRPGWHIECSAMAKKCLGPHFDIHGGGSDLQFPHHENEIAQSEAANGCQFVNYWLHTGMVQVNEEKMAKSLGNFFTIREVLDNYKAEDVRFFLMSAHYRSQLNYSEENLNHAHCSLERLYNALRGVDCASGELIQSHVLDFESAMKDDFNTPKALSVLFELAKELNLAKKQEEGLLAVNTAFTLKHLANVIGLLEQSPDDYLKSVGSVVVDEQEVEQLIKERNLARANKEWGRADEIRAQLLAMHVVLEDAREGTIWRVEPPK